MSCCRAFAGFTFPQCPLPVLAPCIHSEGTRRAPALCRPGSGAGNQQQEKRVLPSQSYVRITRLPSGDPAHSTRPPRGFVADLAAARDTSVYPGWGRGKRQDRMAKFIVEEDTWLPGSTVLATEHQARPILHPVPPPAARTQGWASPSHCTFSPAPEADGIVPKAQRRD